MSVMLEYGNIAHGLVWTHFIGFVHPVLPGKCLLHTSLKHIYCTRVTISTTVNINCGVYQYVTMDSKFYR